MISDYVTFIKDTGEVPKVLCSVSDETFDILETLCVAIKYEKETIEPQDYNALIVEDAGVSYEGLCPNIETILFNSEKLSNKSAFEATMSRWRQKYVTYYGDRFITVKSNNAGFINKLTHPTGTVSIPEPEVLIEEEVTTTQPPKEEKSDWLNRWST
jgi:hypothetical protein